MDAKGQRTQTILDARGRRLAEFETKGNQTRFVYDVADQLVAQIDAKGQVTRFVYDDLGRQVQVMDALGQVTKTTYDQNGNVIVQTDALNHQTQYGYDGRDRQTTVTDALNHVTTTTYDKVGNVLTIKDPDLNTTTYTYDGLNRLVTDTNQLGAARTYGYDENSNQTRVTDRNSQTRTFTYDRLNRQTQENWLNGSGSSIRAITSTYNVGSQLLALQDPDSSYQYTYDLNGRVQTITNAGTPGVVPVVLTYAYDDNGNLKSVVDTINGQAGGTTSYTFDPLDRVSQINQSGTGVQNKRVNLSYNALGQMATLNRYSDLTGTQLVAGTTYTYDALNRLQQLSHQKVDGINVASYTYGYDAASRITSLGSQFADAAYNDNSTYSYDNTNQLAGADHSAISDEGYTYDANGNRTNTGYQTGTGNNNQLSSDGTDNYTYDNEGNLKTRTEIATGKVREFTWDYRNRLTGVTDKTSGTVTQQVSYTYDALNQRIAKTVATPTVGTQTTRFVYDRGNVYLEFSGTSTTPSTRYLYGSMVDQVLAQESNGQTSWMLSDHLGSVRDLVNNSGAVVNHLTYDSFGQVVGSTGTVDTRYKFTGREYDSETGLYYYRARYFDAGVGRFMGQDPMGFGAGDRNLYRYVGNGPIGATDPSGEFKVELRYRGVNGFHADIVVSDKYGKRSYWGGPQNKIFENLPFGPTRLSGSSGGAGIIVADREPSYQSGAKYYVNDNQRDYIQQVYFDKSDCPNKALENKIWISLLRIEARRIPYRLTTTNSNSAAFHTLRQIGLGDSLRPKRYAPGWDYDPFSNKIDSTVYPIGGILTPNAIMGDPYNPVGPPALYKRK